MLAILLGRKLRMNRRLQKVSVSAPTFCLHVEICDTWPEPVTTFHLFEVY